MTAITRNWWIWIVRGIAAIIFGILCFVVPGIVLETLILFFAVYALIDGVLTIVNSFRNRQQPRWWAGLLEGVISILAGIGALLFPGMTAMIMLYFIAFWAIFTGVMEIISAIQLRKEIEGEFWLGLGGVISVVAGVLLILFPGAGILSVLTIVGAYAIVFGIMMILLGWRLRSRGNEGGTSGTRAAA
jgi:uncharacterized membrane protein HdeD (DUF308 family)